MFAENSNKIFIKVILLHVVFAGDCLPENPALDAAGAQLFRNHSLQRSHDL